MVQVASQRLIIVIFLTTRRLSNFGTGKVPFFLCVTYPIEVHRGVESSWSNTNTKISSFDFQTLARRPCRCSILRALYAQFRDYHRVDTGFDSMIVLICLWMASIMSWSADLIAARTLSLNAAASAEGPRDGCAVQSIAGRGFKVLPCLCDKNGDPEIACLEPGIPRLIDVAFITL